MVRASSAAADPEDARGAIALGLKLFEGGDYQGALALFDKSLGMPGTGIVVKHRHNSKCCGLPCCIPLLHTVAAYRRLGVKRFRDKPPQISDGEKQAAYFNIACCQSKLGNVREGLIAVAGCIEAGCGTQLNIHANDLAIIVCSSLQVYRLCAAAQRS